MTELHELSLCEAQSRLRAREFSAVELTEHTLRRIEALDPPDMLEVLPWFAPDASEMKEA